MNGIGSGGRDAGHYTGWDCRGHVLIIMEEKETVIVNGKNCFL